MRETDILLGQGHTVAQVIKSIEVSDVTYYRWLKKYGSMNTSQAKKLRELEKENIRLRRAVSDLTLDKLILKENGPGKLLSPERRRCCMKAIQEILHVSERRACLVLGQHRSVQRQVLKRKNNDEALTQTIVELASRYGRYGYRRITVLLREDGKKITGSVE